LYGRESADPRREDEDNTREGEPEPSMAPYETGRYRRCCSAGTRRQNDARSDNFFRPRQRAPVNGGQGALTDAAAFDERLELWVEPSSPTPHLVSS
jgi:hypothetical protein